MSTLPFRRTRNQKVLVPPSAHTLTGFRAWATSDDFPERGHISFIDGEIYIDMSPENIDTHNQVKLEITGVLYKLNKKRRLGRLYPDRALVTNIEANLSTEPDGTFATWECLESGRLQQIPREDKIVQYMELEGSPDWVAEIVSASSVRKDTKQLRQRYHRARVREYWLIDARGEDIDFQILVWGELDYEPAVTSRGGWQTSPVFGRRFRLNRRRDRMGFWEYTLQVKSLR